MRRAGFRTAGRAPTIESCASLALLLVAAASAPWLWPVGGVHDIVRPYIAPATRYGPGHRGVDLAAADGILLAPADGIVHFAGIVVDRPVLTIDHGGGVLSSYEPVTTHLARGDPVARGQPIGTVLPGHCSVLCVHVGVQDRRRVRVADAIPRRDPPGGAAADAPDRRWVQARG